MKIAKLINFMYGTTGLDGKVNNSINMSYLISVCDKVSEGVMHLKEKR